MTASEHPAEPGPEKSPSEAVIDQLRESYRSLRALVQIVVVCLLILTGSLFLFLLREVSATRRQVRELTQIVANSEKNNVPRMRQFRDKLIEFAKSNADFVPIILRYVNPTNLPGSSQSTNSSQSAGEVAPARMPVVPTK